MIQELREYSQSFFIKLLLGIICVTFVISFGIGTFGDRKETIATINDREILLKDFRKAYQESIQSLRQQFGDNADAYAEQFNIRQRVFEQLVEKKLMVIEAENMNLETTDFELQEQIRVQPYFQKNGQFDYETYNTVLSQNHIIRHDYEDSLREEMMIGKLKNLLANGLVISKADVEEVYQLENEKLEIKYLNFKPEIFLPKVSVTQDEIRYHYEQNKESFKSERYFEISYLALGLDHFKDAGKVREREIRRYYEKNLQSYTTPPKVKARHILLKIEPSATEEKQQERRNELEIIRVKINEGADFEKLAKIHSEDATKEKGGDLGWFQPGEMVPAFEEAAFQLDINQVSEVVQSPFGFHLVRVDDRAEEDAKSLDTVREDITNILDEKRAEKKLEEEISRTEAELTDSSLNEQARLIGLNIERSNRFSKNGIITGIGSAFALVPQLEGKKVGEKGIWKRNPVQGHVVYEIQVIQEPKIREFGDAEQEVKKDLLQVQALNMSKETARKSWEKVATGSSLAELAKKHGLEEQIIEFTASTRSLPQIGQNNGFRIKALSLQESKPYGLYEGEKRSDLIQLIGKSLDTENAEATKDQIRQRLLQQLIQSVLSKELVRLKNRAEIEIINPVFQPIQKST